MKLETITTVTLEEGWGEGVKMHREDTAVVIMWGDEKVILDGDELVSALAALGFELEPDPLAGSTLLPPGAATIAARDDAAMDPGPPTEVRMEQQSHKDARIFLEVLRDNPCWRKETAIKETARIFHLPETVVEQMADQLTWQV